jgi:hypothetical protein
MGWTRRAPPQPAASGGVLSSPGLFGVPRSAKYAGLPPLDHPARGHSPDEIRRLAARAASPRDGLHRALAERACADDGSAPVILERTRHDFGGRCRAAIDQHDDWLVLGEVARARIEALGLLGVAAARRCNLALLQEGIRDRNRLTQGAFSIRYCNAAQAMNASAAMTHKLSPSVSTSFSRRTSLSRSHCSILSANFPAEDVDA